jgi:hypothetical protein
MRARRLPSLALVAVAACATVGDAPSSPPGPPPFRGVRSLVLARRTDYPTNRPKDPLDALEDTLDARGFATRAVDVGYRTPPELRPLERLHSQLGSRIYGSAQGGRSTRRVESLGRDAGNVVATLGVDAVALYHRFDRPPPGTFPDARPPPGMLLPEAPPPGAGPVARRPIGAFSIVNRAGDALWIEWSALGDFDDPDTPANATEAIDALVSVLSGEDDSR